MRRSFAVSFLALASLSAGASAALVSYDFSTSTSASFVASGLTATNFTSQGVTGVLTGGAFQAVNWNNDYTLSPAQSMGFSMVTAGYATATLTSITFDHNADGFFRANGFELAVVVTVGSTQRTFVASPVDSMGVWKRNQTISLGNIAVGAGQAATIRFQGHNNGDPPSDFIALDNVVLNGSVVPAPGAAAITGLACLLTRRRRA